MYNITQRNKSVAQAPSEVKIEHSEPDSYLKQEKKEVNKKAKNWGPASAAVYLLKITINEEQT